MSRRDYYRVSAPVSGGRSLRNLAMTGLALGALIQAGGCIVPFIVWTGFVSDRYYQQVQDAVDALPEVNVTIVNETNQQALVTLASGIKPPVAPPDSVFGIYYGSDYLESAEDQSVPLAAGGTATGTIKCGTVIGISAVTGTPSGEDLVYGYDGYYAEEWGFGLNVRTGNVNFTGAGTNATGSFSGDVISLVRYIRPAEDGLDCAAGTIVVRIQTPAVPSSKDPETDVVTPGTPGTGTVAIE